MTTNLDKYRSDLEALVKLGGKMLEDLQFRHLEKQGQLKQGKKAAAKGLRGAFERDYQRWYTEATALVRQLIPDRLAEFEDLYKSDPKRKGFNGSTYTIQDWLIGVRAGVDRFTKEKLFDDFAAITMRFGTQLQILEAARRRFESSLFDIRQLVQADLLDSQVDSARELASHGFLRAAGAVAGVVVEKHLARVLANRAIQLRNKNPNIGDLNEALKHNGIIDIPAWRQIQRLADIRNLCDRNRDREPTADEVDELVAGASKVTKTLY